MQAESEIPPHELAELRSRVYSFLSFIYLNLPSNDFVKNLVSEDFSSLIKSIAKAAEDTHSNKVGKGIDAISRYIERAQKESPDKVRTDLAVAFTKLFRGVSPGYGPLPPYESVYREGLVEGESTADLRRIYASTGLKLTLREPPDHIGIELAFMARLCSEEARARLSGDEDGARRLVRREAEFLDEHLLKWVPQFCEAAGSYCAEPGAEFYSGVLLLTEVFLELDRRLLEGLSGSGSAA